MPLMGSLVCVLYDESAGLKVWLDNLIKDAKPDDFVVLLIATVDGIGLESQRQIFIDVVLVLGIDEAFDVIEVLLRVELGRNNFERYAVGNV